MKEKKEYRAGRPRGSSGYWEVMDSDDNGVITVWSTVGTPRKIAQMIADMLNAAATGGRA